MIINSTQLATSAVGGVGFGAGLYFHERALTGTNID